MKINKSIFYLLLVFFVNFNALSKENVHIVYEIGGEIITNVDIKNEKNYLFIINPRLKSLNEAQLKEISKQSIIKEKIKKKEIIKYFKLDQTDLYLNELINNLYLKLGFENEESFKQYFSQNLDSETQLINTFEIDSLIISAANLSNYGWKKEAIPVTQTKNTLISKIFKALFS